MKRILYPSLAILSMVMLLSCSHFDKLSENPYALTQAPAEEYVHPIVFKAQYDAMNLFRTNVCMLMQYGINHNTENTARVVSNYNITEGVIDDAWTSYYIRYGNAVKMYDQAVRDKKDGLQGVALILRSLLMMQITDTYGNVPFKDAGKLILSSGGASYYTAYDNQKDIYYALVAMLEDANALLKKETAISFNAVCDKTYEGNFDKWRRFGNSLYARVLMRIGMKVMEENAGLIEFNDDSREDIYIPDRLNDIYQSFVTGAGSYPVLRGRDDRPMVHFDKNNETEQTPFFGYSSGTWNAITACTTLCERMIDGEYKIFQIKKDDGTIEKPFGDKLLWQADATLSGHAPDPRYICWFKKLNGMPAQMISEDHEYYYEHFRSKSGNFLGGSMTRGVYSETQPEIDPIWGQIHDLQNASYYPLMQYSELPFIFAEAGARGWISVITYAGVQTLLRTAVTENILEWNEYFNENSNEVLDYVNWVMTLSEYGTPPSPINNDNILEAILTQKWIANFFIGIEGWCDYRRTGFPVLKTNGPGAANNGILPTRMRYPSDEAYRNVDSFAQAVNGWLGGSNNMQTDVWWADTNESKTNRAKGRQ